MSIKDGMGDTQILIMIRPSKSHDWTSDCGSWQKSSITESYPQLWLQHSPWQLLYSFGGSLVFTIHEKHRNPETPGG